ncbi:restriction endonuclease subunit S [Candidatus Sulfidibacterium hydrothermale]|uniref:restriction endonuclease subunit S n=1 Tax=Candidatus Sulfidibacterium hydrothermale TaxID=2875962 RepID=UPI001F0AE9CF|nr:restriction endonuclease subunit S [Candidatus Sulfidibacterium hydrothermale]UBM62789.1 restriction endonuclease subunit S [Candidatus Sulfidibacterium hydrothermale]
MSEWKKVKLGDIINLKRGYDLPKSKRKAGNVPIVSSSGISGRHTESKVRRPGVITGRYGTIGKVFFIDEDFWPLNTTLYVENFRGNNPKFIFYFLRNFNFEKYSDKSTVPGINRNHIHLEDVIIPPLPEQRAIAEVLSSLDDKIDLLHRQNQTLEQMAETLFRQWFVEEAKDDWEVKPLGELVTVKRGGSPRPIQEYISDRGLRWLKISDATKTNSPFIFEIKEHIKIEGLKKTTLLKKGALVLSNSATPGIPRILQVDSCIHDGWLHFPESHFSNEFLYLLFKKIRPELLMQGNGSIFTNLKTDILKEYPIPIPDDESLQYFNNQVKLIFEKLLKNQIQIRTLEKLRDTLLPKLMSGEVRVKM